MFLPRFEGPEGFRNGSMSELKVQRYTSKRIFLDGMIFNSKQEYDPTPFCASMFTELCEETNGAVSIQKRVPLFSQGPQLC